MLSHTVSISSGTFFSHSFKISMESCTIFNDFSSDSETSFKFKFFLQAFIA